MTDPQMLLHVPSQPRLWIWPTPSATASETAMFGWREARVVVRTVRGRKMRRFDGLHDEFAAALQFPSYYGENLAAFDDCINDLGWLPPEAGYVIVITEPQLVLDSSPRDFPVLVRSLSNAVTQWATPVARGEWWDRPAVPFNVVLVVDDTNLDAVRTRWTDAGADLVNLA